MTLALDAQHVHLWCSFFPAITDERLLEAYRSLLNEPERKLERAFALQSDRRRYLVTRALVRTALSRYSHIAARDWVFAANPYGRPEIANDDVAAGRIVFNVSHTNGLIVVAVAHDRALGVDTENVRHADVDPDLADRYFAPDEVAALHALPETMRQQRFFEYWTLKEAYLKARSVGLSTELDSFSFRFPSDTEIDLSMRADQEHAPSRWRFCQLSIAPHFLVAICAQSLRREALHLVVRSSIPLVSETEQAYVLLRTSTGEVGVAEQERVRTAACLSAQIERTGHEYGAGF